MKLLLLSLFAVGQLQLIDYNTVFSTGSSISDYWKHKKAQRGNFEFSTTKFDKFRGMYNHGNDHGNESKKEQPLTLEQPDKKSRMGRSSEKVTEVKTNWFSPIVLMYQWYGSCHQIHQERKNYRGAHRH